MGDHINGITAITAVKTVDVKYSGITLLWDLFIFEYTSNNITSFIVIVCILNLKIYKTIQLLLKYN